MLFELEEVGVGGGVVDCLYMNAWEYLQILVNFPL